MVSVRCVIAHREEGKRGTGRGRRTGLWTSSSSTAAAAGVSLRGVHELFGSVS